MEFTLIYWKEGRFFTHTLGPDYSFLPEVDVIVCLGGGKGRIPQALKLWLSYENALKKPQLYFAGLNSKMTQDKFLHHIKPYGYRIPNTYIVIENESTSTLSNAVKFRQYLKEAPAQSFVLVTSNYHIKRAQFIFQQVLQQAAWQGVVWVHPVEVTPYTQQDWYKTFRGMRVTVREMIKSWYYRYFLPHPAAL